MTAKQGTPSWGRVPAVTQAAVALHWRDQILPLPARAATTVLPYGLGRSYGDSCLNDGGAVLTTTGLDRFMQLDEDRGTLTCEAGVDLGAVLDLIVPRGFFLPVTPGTRFVTVGGAVANDVHGKNHHRDGTFGHAVRRFELLRSDGSRRVCSPADHADLFRATIGGLGLTGLVTWVEFGLKRIPGPWIQREAQRFGGLDEFFTLAAASQDHEYTVAWIDALARGPKLGRGVFFRGNHVAGGVLPAGKGELTLPMDLPRWALSRANMRLFNTAYFARARRPRAEAVPYAPFFYPLDRIRSWNRLYGRRGFFQYQCVVPPGAGAAVRDLLAAVSNAGSGSFLSVLKTFGTMPPAGLLSFPRPGVTLALDFPNTGAPVLALFERLDHIVRAAGGAVYPAKDARMSAASFQAFYPRWRELSQLADPRFSSSFWRRVTGPGGV